MLILNRYLGVRITKNVSWTEHIRNILQTVSQKMGLLYKTWLFFSDKQLSTIYKSCIPSQIEYCSSVWGGDGCVALGILGRIQYKDCDLIKSPLLTNQLPTLQLRREVASLSLFYQYFYGHCSDELLAIIPPPLHRSCPTWDVQLAHSHSLAVPFCRKSSCQVSFRPRLVKLLNSLPQRCFPDNFNLRSFKEKCYNLLLPVEIHW